MFNTNRHANDFFYIHKWKNNNIAHLWAHVIEYKKICFNTYGSANHFFIHIGEERVILHICEPTHGFFDSQKRRKKMILYTCKPTNGFFDSCMRRIERILHICKPIIGFFFIHAKQERKWHAHLLARKWFFFNSHRWQSKMIFPICEWFFFTHIGGKT